MMTTHPAVTRVYQIIVENETKSKRNVARTGNVGIEMILLVVVVAMMIPSVRAARTARRTKAHFQ